MRGLPNRVAGEFERLKKLSKARLALKVINGRYYVYKERGIWVKETHRNKTISEYLGRISENGVLIRKSMRAKNDLESARALIEEHGGSVIWNMERDVRTDTNTHHIDVDEVDISILTSLSMNSRMPISKAAQMANINEQTAYSRIKALERRFGIRYILEINTSAFGFTTYLILVNFEDDKPSVEELTDAFKREHKVQFAAVVKGDYDVIAYMLAENSAQAEDDLWSIMSRTSLAKYNAKWNMIPFGQVYSFVPLRKEFIEDVLAEMQTHGKKPSDMAPTKTMLTKREFMILDELNNNAALDFSVLDRKFGLGRGASRYTYQKLRDKGIITRATLTITDMPVRYIGILRIETVNPGELSGERYRLLYEELEDGPMANKYALIGNTSMPEGLTLFIPIVEKDELEDALAPLSSINGTTLNSMIISKTLTGSLCYRRFDKTHTLQYISLLGQKKVELQQKKDYD